jgi:nicotinamide mononucleotide transporter
LSDILHQFIEGIKATTPLEAIAVVFGIASVFFSRRESIWVYPVGMVNTIIYIYISFEGQLLGEASVNIYYTIMSIWGWWLWGRRNPQHEKVLLISTSSAKEWRQQLLFFALFYIGIYAALTYLKKDFAQGAIPWADAFASATAYTGMWLMAKKKVESWWWWIFTNLASIPLYFVKGYVFTSFQYILLVVLAVLGLLEWQKKYREQQAVNVAIK